MYTANETVTFNIAIELTSKTSYFMIVKGLTLNMGRHPVISVIFFTSGVHVDLNCSF